MSLADQNTLSAELKKIGIVSPELEAKWLLDSNKSESFLKNAIALRADGYPLAYILGEKDFYGFTFKITEDVLIPRPETEHIVDKALAWLNKNPGSKNVYDFGAGSGCIGLSIAKKNESVFVTLVEKSVAAVKIIEENARRLNVFDRIRILNADVMAADLQPADLIVANPPYIDPNDENIDAHVKKFEPHTALFAKHQGFSDIQSWAVRAAGIIKSPGLILFEIGSGQGAKAEELFKSLSRFTKISVIKDYSGLDRVVSGLVE